MRKSLILSFLLLCATWVIAQTYPSQNPSQSPSQTSTEKSTDNQTAVQGCVSGSNGNYTLTDDSGTTYQLSGATSKLSDHVGHKVEIKGTTTESGKGPSSSGSSTSTDAKSQPTLKVTSIKHLSGSCGASNR